MSYIIYFQFLSESKEYWFGISPEGIGFIGMFINFFVAFVVSSQTALPHPMFRKWWRKYASLKVQAKPLDTEQILKSLIINL